MNHRLNTPFTKNGFQQELEERKIFRKIKQLISFLLNSANRLRLTVMGSNFNQKPKNINGHVVMMKKPSESK
ncbi:hypothetical protein AD998_15145 [bacterium 336/3]|nr:hypothetical protein AD998_20795 [bacterium 336/3]KOY87307.1 hypothetical protein AD998_15145 [bacterium 336/3]